MTRVRLWVMVVVIFGTVSVFPNATQATEFSFINTIRERIEYFFAFSAEAKVQVLERQAERRLDTAKERVQDGREQEVLGTLESYLQLKEQQNKFIGTADDGILENIELRTLEQQRTMEEIKTMVSGETKQNVVMVQEQVVNQVAKNIVDFNGPVGQTEFFNKVQEIWAPGTGPGEGGTTYAPGTTETDNGGVVIEGGKIQFAPGTSAGGESGVVIEGGSQQFAPGTSGGSGGSVIKNIEIKTGGGGGGAGQ